MRTRKKIVVDDIVFDPSGPTRVPMARLFAWVIWQFPRMRAGGFSGAVHPPKANHGWYPAVIDIDAGQVLIFGYIRESFPSPEAAAKHLDQVSAE